MASWSRIAAAGTDLTPPPQAEPAHQSPHRPTGAATRSRWTFPVERRPMTTFDGPMLWRAKGRNSAWSGLTILVLALALLGCSDERSDADGSTTTVKQPSTTTASESSTTTTEVSTTTVAGDPVIAAYLAFWNMYIELGGTPPPFNASAVTPRLEELTTGDEKAQLFDFLQKNAATGLVLRGDIAHSPTVVSNDGSVAIVRDCMDDRTGVYRVADNSRVDTDSPARHLYTVSLRKDGGTWRVETVTTGPEPCTV